MKNPYNILVVFDMIIRYRVRACAQDTYVKHIPTPRECLDRSKSLIKYEKKKMNDEKR